MYTPLGEAPLRDGATMQVGVVLGPDEEWAPRIVPFLGHKNRDTRAHIARSLAHPLDSLQTRYYVGSVEGRLISQIMVAGDRGAGILGHVYTLLEERGRGACSALMAPALEHSRASGYEALLLGTTFDSVAYQIYHRFGFRSITPVSGCMRWLAEPQALARRLAPGVAEVRELEWSDWGWFEALALQPPARGEEYPRCPTLDLKIQGSVEGAFTSFQLRRERATGIQARALVSGTGATVGWALLAPDSRWFGDTWLLDVSAQPGFEPYLPELLASLELPDAPVSAYLTEPPGARAAALRRWEMRPTLRLPQWLIYAGGRRDLWIWERYRPAKAAARRTTGLSKYRRSGGTRPGGAE